MAVGAWVGSKSQIVLNTTGIRVLSTRYRPQRFHCSIRRTTVAAAPAPAPADWARIPALSTTSPLGSCCATCCDTATHAPPFFLTGAPLTSLQHWHTGATPTSPPVPLAAPEVLTLLADRRPASNIAIATACVSPAAPASTSGAWHPPRPLPRLGCLFSTFHLCRHRPASRPFSAAQKARAQAHKGVLTRREN